MKLEFRKCLLSQVEAEGYVFHPTSKAYATDTFQRVDMLKSFRHTYDIVAAQFAVNEDLQNRSGMTPDRPWRYQKKYIPVEDEGRYTFTIPVRRDRFAEIQNDRMELIRREFPRVLAEYPCNIIAIEDLEQYTSIQPCYREWARTLPDYLECIVCRNR